MEPYWSESNGHAPPHSVKYESEAAVSSFPYCTESSLNFSTSGTAYSEDDAEYATGRRNKTSRQDPLSHRIIEKRRRDRMNSCLADLSRLIPPQYQRKGRGRIEKTEIIEMAIRHLKHLQNECLQKENDYRSGYTDCMKEAAKFLYDSQMQDFCYRLLPRLQEHCDEIMKSDCFKLRGCHTSDNVSASSGSPHQVYPPAPPLCQLRDMLGASDIEHSNDHNDVKDLSFRNHLNQLQRNGIKPVDNSQLVSNSNASAPTAASPNMVNSTTASNVSAASIIKTAIKASPPQPHQAPVITSTAPHNHSHLHTDSSNHDFESSHEPILHTDTSNMHSPPPRDTLLHSSNVSVHHHSNSHLHHNSSDSLSARLRNYSESSHDVEHNNNYKYKNHIKERFRHELHDEETSSEHCPAAPMLQSEHSHTHSLSEHSKDGTEPEIAPIIAKKRKLAEQAAAAGHVETLGASTTSSSLMGRLTATDEKPFTPFGKADIKSELNERKVLITAPCSTTANVPPANIMRSFAVPIFALHGQGAYYVPLNVDYSALQPFLNGMDLLEKNYGSMPVVHPININVNFMPPNPSASLLAAAVAVASSKQQVQTSLNGVGNSSSSSMAAKAHLDQWTGNAW